MDAGAQGAVIGIGVMVFIVIVYTVRERCQKTTPNEHTHLVRKQEPILIEKVLTKKHSSMRDFLKENVSGSELKVIRIS